MWLAERPHDLKLTVPSLVFGLTRVFPGRPTKFLEWGRNSGLLRVTGSAYQFRHDSYRRWLTEHSEISVSATGGR